MHFGARAAATATAALTISLTLPPAQTEFKRHTNLHYS